MLTAVQKKFILHWGEMGSRWGISRSVAQVHALLYISPQPLAADEIAETLSIARSNVSTSLKELQDWGVVRVTHTMGDRRDHFESMTDVWEMFQLILDKRKQREVDPTIAALAECLSEIGNNKRDALTKQRLQALHDFFTTMSDWYRHMRVLPNPLMKRFVKLGDKLEKALGWR